MDITEALQAYLTGDSNFSDLAGTRLYPILIPQDATMPAAAYQQIGSADEIRGHAGPTGMARARIQFTAAGSDYSSCKGLAAAIKGLLWGYRGVLSGSVFCFDCEVTNEIDGYSFTDTEYTTRLDAIMLYSLNYSE
jgi:hypothetical protein